MYLPISKISAIFANILLTFILLTIRRRCHISRFGIFKETYDKACRIPVLKVVNDEPLGNTVEDHICLSVCFGNEKLSYRPSVIV